MFGFILPINSRDFRRLPGCTLRKTFWKYNTLVRNIEFCLNFDNLSVLKVYAMYFSVYNIRACAVTTDLNVNRESFLLTPEFVMAH